MSRKFEEELESQNKSWSKNEDCKYRSLTKQTQWKGYNEEVKSVNDKKESSKQQQKKRDTKSKYFHWSIGMPTDITWRLCFGL